MKRFLLALQVLIALIVGAIVGFSSKTVGLDVQVLGAAFIRLIEMAIVPLIFPLIVLGVAQMRSVRRLGRIAGKTILYFEVVTTVILIVAVILANVTGVGRATSLPGQPAQLSGIAQGIDFETFLLDIIPKNIFSALANGNLLPIVFFSIFLGLALATLGDEAKPVTDFLESMSKAMFKVIEYIVKFTPIGVFGYIAYDIAKYGWASLGALAEFIAVAYVGFALIVFVILPITAMIFRVKYWSLLRAVWDLVFLAFITRSSEVVLAPLTERLEQYGADNSIVSFVLPTGYSFNLDGATLYEAVAVIFLSHVYGIHFSIGHQFAIIGILMVLTKGLAGVPSAAIVVLLATAKSIGLPAEGIALLMGIDFVIDMARTATNVIGNSLASIVIAKSENVFRVKTPSPLAASNDI
ncbi:dicarboxylate/amino acid:cation symporter [Alicyclobacillus ferrooxydans]|uniref:C4-dicarboxylate transporter n=1 Tax=Alicyclobacillus ferrooxydans TaxID=471514 RepID=A0A0P9C6Q9_9BACL|nr:cation:dicarboxylase symporter family transporter [Alicyclobacillus ferrooxydans]KPV40830.1 C4-dicarboxylate transporter [Alicyclobacillus ferrooxydans]